jgi:hypothetical protein
MTEELLSQEEPAKSLFIKNHAKSQLGHFADYKSIRFAE